MATTRKTSAAPASFRLTYATMFDPPATLHASYDRALAQTKADLGREYPMLIGGREVRADARFEDKSPINRDWLLGTFQKGGAQHARDALAAARAAAESWGNESWETRVKLLRKAA